MWSWGNRIIDKGDTQREFKVQRVGDNSGNVIFGFIVKQKNLPIQLVYNLDV